jgi:hypothetical protein
MFGFKHHVLLVPEITAANRIINAKTRLSSPIAGIQEACPDKIKDIQSPSETALCPILP